jgi:hypothetical protein
LEVFLRETHDILSDVDRNKKQALQGVTGGLLILCIKYIAFVCYPPKPDTSHNGGLVGLYVGANMSHAQQSLMRNEYVLLQEDALMKTEDLCNMLYMWLHLQACRCSG